MGTHFHGGYIMTINMLLYITLILYVLVLGLAITFNIKWLLIIAGLLWFIPLTEISNTFIIIISITMIIVHFMLGIKEEKDDF